MNPYRFARLACSALSFPGFRELLEHAEREAARGRDGDAYVLGVTPEGATVPLGKIRARAGRVAFDEIEPAEGGG